MSVPRLRMAGVQKRFGAVHALRSVDLEVDTREVHGLLGGNGAGKTTLMNVLYGLYQGDAGRIEIDGQPVEIASPRDAIAVGVGMVHQTFLQIDSYTVTENIVLGSRDLGVVKLDLRDARRRIVELSKRFGLSVDPDAVVETLPVGVRQRVEILKALYRDSRILILDEPTTNLTPQEVDDLFGSMRAMVEEDMSVILITHKIRETMSVCDRMTVMRDGERVATLEREDTDADHLATMMVGDDAEVQDRASPLQHALGADSSVSQPDTGPDTRDEKVTGHAGGLEVLELRAANDHGVMILDGLELNVRAGEVVGIAGVAGNGQVELAEALSGVRPIEGGRIRLDGDEFTGRPTAQWLAEGVAYVPEDRNRDGILPTRSVAENLLLGSHRTEKVKSGGWIDWGRARANAASTIERFSIRASGPNALAGDLSGGNVQRVILARAFAHEPRLLVLHNPTRGLDIRSTQFVYEQIRRATGAGCAVLLISEDLDEVLALSDRIHSLYVGRITGEWAGGTADRYEIGRSMTGVVKSHD